MRPPPLDEREAERLVSGDLSVLQALSRAIIRNGGAFPCRRLGESTAPR